MKTFLTIIMLAGTASLTSAQSLRKPAVATVDDRICFIENVETNPQATVLTFRHQNNRGSVNVNPMIYLLTPDGKQYYFKKAEGIPLAPDNHIFRVGEESLVFKVYFQPLPKGTKVFDVHETEPRNGSFNFYGVNLEKHRESDQQISTIEESTIIRDSATVNVNLNPMEQVMPMFGNMMNTVLESVTNYYKQPGKLQELALLHKQFFDALVAQGFSKEQALQILINSPLFKLTSLSK